MDAGMEFCIRLVTEMKDKKENILLQSMVIILLVVLSYILARILGLTTRPRVVKCEMAVLMIVALLTYISRIRKGDLDGAVSMIIAGGIIMRIGYMLYTNVDVRSHDLFEIDVNGAGHAGYLLTVMKKHCLPTSNSLQLYQQPFYYIIGACFSGLIHLFLEYKNDFYLVDAAKTVSCMASCISILIYKRILEECDLNKEQIKNAMLAVTFIPAFYLTGGRVGVNALATMFMMLAFLYTLRFMKSPDWKNTIVLAVIYGFGVMTKISCAVLAIFTAWIFIKKLMEKKEWKERRELLFKYTLFGMISLPLGLWYSVRNYILFRQPLNYVLRQSDSSELYTGNYSVVRRLIGVDISNLLKSPYVNVREDYNAPVYYMKSALFGELTYLIPGFLPVILLWCTVIVSFAVFAAIIWQFTKNRKDKMGNLVAAVMLWYYGNMLFFYYQYPHGCSMDFRYMLFITVPTGILLVKYMSAYPLNSRSINWVIWGEVICSCVMYCMI